MPSRTFLPIARMLHGRLILVSIHLSWRKRSEVHSIKDVGKWSLKVILEDRGIDVSLPCRDSVFDYPHDPSVKSANRGLPVQQQTGGAGLGLYTLVARIAALHGQYGYHHPRPELDPSQSGGKVLREKRSICHFQIPIALPPELSSSFSDRSLLRSSSRKNSKGGAGEGEATKPFVRAMGEPSRSLLSYSLMPSIKNNATTDQTKSAESSFAGHVVQSPVASGASSPASSKGIKKTKQKSSLHILVAEDSLSIRKMCAMVLSKQIHRVDVAVNGQDATDKLIAALLKLHQEERYDAVLMDIQMPGMDGLTATKLNREREEEEEEKIQAVGDEAKEPVLIIGMSACSDNVVAEQAHEAGMDFFLPKPFSSNQFYSILVDHRS